MVAHQSLDTIPLRRVLLATLVVLLFVTALTLGLDGGTPVGTHTELQAPAAAPPRSG